ncbi:GIY-YIG nuclease family protein [Agromyces larvae]|uniref:GIY-YIG nuclease family protein n=1 Tax=Agromyces larvae TaxID=2929802 RepID=A0ABY4C0Q4_9MICO|nr:GIY-YIG nuclease family protein [Agromyces larvae]UOE45057.1 GIY-YIG nuclease family protein [Agromyces larvae]
MSAPPPTSARTCDLQVHGVPCGAPVADDAAPIALCTRHLLVAHDWVVREVGSTDLLPSPCRLCGARVGVRYPGGWLCGACEWRVGDVPDDDLVLPSVEVVYYVRYDDRVKIGTSSRPRQRISALPHHEVLAFELGGRLLERRRHEQFAAHRIPGTEWFEANDALSAHVAAIADGIDDPWQRYAFWLSREAALHGAG